MKHEKTFLVESTNSEQFEQSSNAPFKNQTLKSDSIYLQEVYDSTKNTHQSKDEKHQKPSLLGNVPLLLQKRKQGIIQDNMKDKDIGIQKWKFGKMIAGGGSGRVYRALNSITGCLYAVKKIHLCEADEAECKTEIAILSKISHQNIVHYVQHYHLPQQTWIFMEYVPGTLKQFYKDFGPPPLDTFLYFSNQLITALDYLHQNKIVHKDLKCANVLLTNKGILKLTDFGCSKDFDKTLSFMRYEEQGSKTQKGTSHWMAPQTIIDAIYNRKTDIWSLGCTLLELATGNPPWTEVGLDSHKIMIYIGSKNQIPKIPDQLPALTKQLIKGCLVRDPNLRATCKQLLKLIERGKKE